MLLVSYKTPVPSAHYKQAQKINSITLDSVNTKFPKCAISIFILVNVVSSIAPKESLKLETADSRKVLRFSQQTPYKLSMAVDVKLLLLV